MTVASVSAIARDRESVVSVAARDGLRAWTLGSLIVVAAAPAFAVVGIPQVPLMWPLYQLGVVLPGCGLTRGVVALAGGDLAASLRWNPASPVVVLVAIVGVARAVVGACSGRWLAVRIAPRPWLVTSARSSSPCCGSTSGTTPTC